MFVWRSLTRGKRPSRRRIIDLGDLDGSNAERTLAFSFDGKHYEIDLNKKNRAAFEKALAPYVEAARSVRQTRSRSSSTGSRSSGANKERLQAIREWAKGQGLQVADRGRISQAIQDQYDAAK